MAQVAVAAVTERPGATRTSPFAGLRLSEAQRTLLNGGVAGCVAKTATAPLTRLIVLVQTGAGAATTARSGVGCLKQVLRQEGVLSLWKGNVCSCVHRLPFSAITFGMVEACWRVCPDLCQKSGKLLPGAVASCTAVVACYPLEVIRTHQMVQRGKAGKIATLIRELWQKGGVSHMYRGLGTALMATVPAVSISFSVYGSLMSGYSTRREEMRPLEGCLFGGIAGVVGSSSTFPLDVLRRRLQVMIMDQSLPQRSSLAETRHLWQTGGLQGFYRGLTLEVVKAFPAAAVAFATYEWLKLL